MIEELYNKVTNRKLLLFFSLVALFLLFKDSIEKFARDYIAAKFLDQVHPSYISDIVCASFFSVMLVIFCYRWSIKYRISYDTLIIHAVLLIGYTYYRFFYRIGEYTPFEACIGLKYLDVVIVPFLGTVTLFLKSKIRPTKLFLSEDRKGFRGDRPISHGYQDKLRRHAYAKEIAQVIMSTENIEQSFAIGIAGAWGAGKTSFMALIAENLPASETIVIDFFPWYSSSASQINSDFFNAFNASIRKYSSSLSDDLLSYSQSLTEAYSNRWLKLLHKIASFFFGRSSTREKFLSVNKTLVEIGKRVVVFIDDLDRIDKAEVVEVMRLIRNTANFSNTFFVVAYDRSFVLEAIENFNASNHSIYLEKIFQLEITLPQHEGKIISLMLEERIKEIVGGGYEKEISKFFSSMFERYSLSNEIKNLRDVERYLNLFYLSFQMLKKDIYLTDLLSIEVIKCKYPQVYDLLYLRQKEIFGSGKTINANNTFTLSGDTQNPKFKVYLLDNKGRLHLNADQIDDVIKALWSIFPQGYVAPDDKSITNPQHFHKYFALGLFESDLPENEFQEFRQKALKEFKDQIVLWVNKRMYFALRNRFKEIHSFENREDFEKIIEAIIFFDKQIIPDSILSGYDLNNLATTLYDYRSIANKYYGGEIEKYKAFLFGILKSAQSPFITEMRLLYEFDDFDDFLLTIEELQKLRLIYTAAYLAEISEIDSDFWTLYHKSKIKPRNSQSYPISIEKKSDEEVNTLFREAIREKLLDSFIVEITHYSHREDNAYSVSDVVAEIYGSYKDFEDELNSMPNNRFQYLDEFKSFYSLLLKENKPVPFKFMVIPSGLLK